MGPTSSQKPAARISLMLLALAGAGLGIVLAVLPLERLVILPALAILLIIAIFALMPRPLAVSDRQSWILLVTFLALFCLYPSYVPLRLPGMPWINPIRIAAGALLIVWTYHIFASRGMGASIGAFGRREKVFFFAFWLFLAAQILSLPTAIDLEQALTRFSLFQLYWTFVFFAALTLIDTQKRIQKILLLLVVCAGIQCILGFIEAYRERPIWLSVLPANFGADNEFLQRALQGTFRFDVYRVQNSFSVSLLYAEFVVLLLPFAIYLAVDGNTPRQRIMGWLVALAILPAQFLSGSRSGMVGVIAILIVQGTLLTIRGWLKNRKSLLMVVMVTLAPALGVAAVGAYFASPRLQSYVVGGGQHEASNEGRREQFRAAVPLSMSRPAFGHGIGLGAEALGFRNLAGVLTIDSYVINLMLEVGYIGLFAFILMISWGIVAGARLFLTTDTAQGRIGGAISASLAAFAAIKTVLSQTDNHMLLFLFLALLLQLRRADAAASAAHAPAPDKPRPGSARRIAPARPGHRIRGSR